MTPPEINLTAAEYERTQVPRSQARAHAHNPPNETSITVYAGATPIAVVSDGHSIAWLNFPAFNGATDVQTDALAQSALEFALAAADLSLRAMEAGVEDVYGRGS